MADKGPASKVEAGGRGEWDDDDDDAVNARPAGPAPSAFAVRSVASLLHLLVKVNTDVLEFDHVQLFPLFASDWKHQHLSVGTYMYRLEQFAACSPDVFVAALCLLKKLQEHRAMPPITQVTFHRSFFACLVVAIKLYEDHTLAHADLATVGCLTPAELSKMELEVFARLNFCAHVSHKTHALVVDELVLFTNLSRSQYEKVGLEGALANPEWGLSISDVLRESVMRSQSLLRAARRSNEPPGTTPVGRRAVSSSGAAPSPAELFEPLRRRSDNMQASALAAASLKRFGDSSSSLPPPPPPVSEGGGVHRRRHRDERGEGEGEGEGRRESSSSNSNKPHPFVLRPTLSKSSSFWRWRSPRSSAKTNNKLGRWSTSASSNNSANGAGGGGEKGWLGRSKSQGKGLARHKSSASVSLRKRKTQKHRSLPNDEADGGGGGQDGPLSPDLLESRRSSGAYSVYSVQSEARPPMPPSLSKSSSRWAKMRAKRTDQKKAKSVSTRPVPVFLMRMDSL